MFLVVQIVCCCMIDLSAGLTWASANIPNETRLVHCDGDDARIPWSFKLRPGEKVTHINWFFSNEKTDRHLATHVLEHFLPVPGGHSPRLRFLPNAGVELFNLTLSDFGLYTVQVHALRGETYVTATQSARVSLPDAPVLEDDRLTVSLLPEAVYSDVTRQWHLQLSCGHFVNLGNPAVSVLWTTPSGEVLESSFQRGGFFVLTLPNSVLGGTYSCFIDKASPALACTKSVRPPSKAGAYVTVDAVESRVTLLEAHLAGLQEENRSVHALLNAKDKMIANLTSELEGREERFAMAVANLGRQLKDAEDNCTSHGERLRSASLASMADLERRLRQDWEEKRTEDRRQRLQQQQENIASLTEMLQKDTVKSCMDALYRNLSTGVYTLSTAALPSSITTIGFKVFCQEGWTVIQRRQDGSEVFHRAWEYYERGFGDLAREFWLGLDLIYRLTSAENQSLRIDMEDKNGNKAYAQYADFRIDGPTDKYRLHISGFSGTVDDNLAYHNTYAFSTYDQDNDDTGSNCAKQREGAWWFNSCDECLLNGPYRTPGRAGDDGVIWDSFGSGSLKSVVMRIRPKAEN